MLDLFKEMYYYLDLLVGFGSPFLIYFLYKTGRVQKMIWHFFWIGAAIGLLWEVPIFVVSGESTSLPIIVWITPLITHYSVFMLSHSLWDGLIFVIGIWIVYLTCTQPYFEKFRWSELCVLLLWGQVSELMVELSSTLNDGWAFVKYWWNPVLFKFNGHNIALLMQVVWLLAATLFYLLLVKLKPRYN